MDTVDIIGMLPLLTYMVLAVTEKVWPAREFPPRKGWQWIGAGFLVLVTTVSVVVPLLIPLGLAFGIDPIHLGIIFLSNMELGFLAPPVGLNLLLSSYRFNKPMVEVMHAVLPMLGVQFVGVLLITYIEPMTTWLPHLFGHR